MNGDTRLGCGPVFVRLCDPIRDEIGHYECPPVMGGQGHESDEMVVPAVIAFMGLIGVVALFAGLAMAVLV